MKLLLYGLQTDQDKVAWLFDQVLGRTPTAEEVTLFAAFQPTEGVPSDDSAHFTLSIYSVPANKQKLRQQRTFSFFNIQLTPW